MTGNRVKINEEEPEVEYLCVGDPVYVSRSGRDIERVVCTSISGEVEFCYFDEQRISGFKVNKARIACANGVIVADMETDWKTLSYPRSHRKYQSRRKILEDAGFIGH
ncbi:hypothetical protein HY450_02165 [Candidatus Pacearchaeota archaeon]|nr:hypothetical protein [Candidatus Pacearchaeota archaeon]